MLCLAHDESVIKSSFRPRHPMVCALNILGVALSLFLLSLAQSTDVQLYFTSLILLYIASTLYHWLHYTTWARRLDHSMIFVVIAMTGLPYWNLTFPAPLGLPGYLVAAGITAVGVGVKMVSFLSSGVSGVAYVCAALPITGSFIFYWHDVPVPYAAVWLLGTSLYFVQLLILGFRRCDVFPEQFGFREVQHVVLLSATTIHSFVAFALVG